MTRDPELHQLLATKLEPLEPLPSGAWVVYGAGNIGREVAERLNASGRTVVAFLDARVKGSIAGIPVLNPADERARAFAKDGLPVTIGIFNYTVDPLPVWTLLESLGFQRIVSFNEFQEHFELQPHFWLTQRAHVLESRDRIQTAWELFADDESRDIFLDSLRLRLTFDPRLLREPTWQQQYLPDGLPRPKTPLRLIDGGAFTGDTIEFLVDKCGRLDAVAAFEPDAANFRSLRETVTRRAGSLGDVSLWPCGTSDSTRLASFRSGQGAGSTVADDGDVHIQLVALDEVLPTFEPTYIKLDIEGAELATLKGAAEMIRRHQPSLAVCVYHVPDHLWEIPLYMGELAPTHRIALRYHTFQAFELVAYAFPE